MERITAIYARQSIDKKDSLSIEGQIELCRAEAGGAPVEVYTDRGYSGKNIKRPDFTRLMKNVSEGRVAKVICYRLDRISRSITDFGQIWETLSAHGVEFVSVNEKFDTSTPVGRAMLYIIMVFAQLERETIAERVKDNYYQRVKRGAWPGGPVPFGYEIKKTSKGTSLAPGPNIDDVVKLFEMYSRPGQSLGSVCRWLKSEAIPRPSGLPTWPAISLNRVLRNPLYVKADATVYAYYKAKGFVMANDIEDFSGQGIITIGKNTGYRIDYGTSDPPLLALSMHAGIIPADMFLRVQHKLDENKQFKRTGTGKYTWLSGLLKCGGCGYSIRPQRTKGRVYFMCTGRTLVRSCSLTHSETVEAVEEYVGRAIQERLNGFAAQGDALDLDIADAKSKLSVIEDKIGNLVAALSESSGITIKYVNQEIEALDAKRQEILARMSSKGVGRLFGFDGAASIDWDSMDFEGKKALAQMLIEHVACTTNSLEITWKE